MDNKSPKLEQKLLADLLDIYEHEPYAEVCTGRMVMAISKWGQALIEQQAEVIKNLRASLEDEQRNGVANMNAESEGRVKLVRAGERIKELEDFAISQVEETGKVVLELQELQRAHRKLEGELKLAHELGGDLLTIALQQHRNLKSSTGNKEIPGEKDSPPLSK